MSSQYSNLWMPRYPGPIPVSKYKVYTTTDVNSVITQADTNGDGHLTQDELSAYKNRVNDQYMLMNFRYDPNSAKNQEIATILSDNFASIANNAKKSGEYLPVHAIYPNSIETSDINRLAGFDGNGNNLTISDVRQLQNANTSNWPRTNGLDNPPPEPTPYPQPQPGSNNDLQQLFMQLIQLILGSLFGGNSQSGGYGSLSSLLGGLLGGSNNNSII